MMRAVLRGDAAAALRWRRVELVLGAKQAEVDAFIAEDDASTRNLRQQTELEDWLDECAEARRGIDADPDSPDTPDTVFESGSAPGPTDPGARPMPIDRVSVLKALEAQGVCPVFYNPDPEVAMNVIRACARGGAPVIEFTNRGDFAVDLFAEIAKELGRTDPDIVLGIGSVLDAGTAAMYLNRAARFVVSPALVPEVATVCNRRMVAYFPGCGSVRDITEAHALG
eukprot:gene60399-80558_t